LTITFWRDITTAPLASVAVTIIGSISGVRPTAIDSANSAASHQSPLATPLITSTSGAITSMKRISTQLTRLMPAWKALVPRSVAVTRCARAPKKVRSPVCTMSAVAVPLITLVPMKSRFSRSSTPASWSPRSLDELLDRHRFARQRGLADEQVLGGEQARIGRDHVAGRERDHVARHEVAHRHLDAHRARVRGVEALVARGAGLAPRRGPQHRGGVAHHRLEPVGRLVGARLLQEAQHRRQHHHAADHQRGLHVLGHVRDQRQHREQQVERIAVALPQVRPPRQRLLVAHLVAAQALAQHLRVAFAQALRRAAEHDEHLAGVGARCGGQRLRDVGRHATEVTPTGLEPSSVCQRSK
jgi:hypothetical protein